MGVMPSYDMFKRQMLTILEAKRLANAWDQMWGVQMKSNKRSSIQGTVQGRKQVRHESRIQNRDKQYIEEKDVFLS